jgi:hypothetical protein
VQRRASAAANWRPRRVDCAEGRTWSGWPSVPPAALDAPTSNATAGEVKEGLRVFQPVAARNVPNTGSAKLRTVLMSVQRSSYSLMTKCAAGLTSMGANERRSIRHTRRQALMIVGGHSRSIKALMDTVERQIRPGGVRAHDMPTSVVLNPRIVTRSLLRRARPNSRRGALAELAIMVRRSCGSRRRFMRKPRTRGPDCLGLGSSSAGADYSAPRSSQGLNATVPGTGSPTTQRRSRRTVPADGVLLTCSLPSLERTMRPSPGRSSGQGKSKSKSLGRYNDRPEDTARNARIASSSTLAYRAPR